MRLFSFLLVMMKATACAPTATTPADTPAATPPSAALDPATNYSAVDGDGDSTLLNEEGEDPNTVRIEDDETALASGADSDDVSAPDGRGRIVGIAIVIVAAVAAGVIWLLIAARRRKNDERTEEEA